MRQHSNSAHPPGDTQAVFGGGKDPSPFQPSLDKNRIMALAALVFIDHSEVVHFLDPPGSGKSHLSLALGVQGHQGWP